MRWIPMIEIILPSFNQANCVKESKGMPFVIKRSRPYDIINCDPSPTFAGLAKISPIRDFGI